MHLYSASVQCICIVSVFDPSGAFIIVFIIILRKKILIIEKYMNGIKYDVTVRKHL